MLQPPLGQEYGLVISIDLDRLFAIAIEVLEIVDFTKRDLDLAINGINLLGNDYKFAVYSGDAMLLVHFDHLGASCKFFGALNCPCDGPRQCATFLFPNISTYFPVSQP